MRNVIILERVKTCFVPLCAKVDCQCWELSGSTSGKETLVLGFITELFASAKERKDPLDVKLL